MGIALRGFRISYRAVHIDFAVNFLASCRYSRTRLVTLQVTVEPPFLGQFEYKSVMHKGAPKEFVGPGGNGGVQQNVRARHPGA
eukprot:2235359-Rhodomonas_salina.3